MSAPARKPGIKLVIAALVCGLLLYNAVDYLFFHLNNNTAMVLLFLSAALQWGLLRSEWAGISVWLPMLLSTLCALLGACIDPGAIHTDSYLLIGLGVPVYFGSAAMIVIMALVRLIRQGE